MRSSLVFWLFGILISIVAFLITSVIFDVVQIFDFILVLLFYLGNVDPNGQITSLITSLILIFLWDLGLRLTISRKRVIKLSLVFVFISILILPIGVVLILFNQRSIAVCVPGVNLSIPGRWL